MHIKIGPGNSVNFNAQLIRKTKTQPMHNFAIHMHLFYSLSFINSLNIIIRQ